MHLLNSLFRRPSAAVFFASAFGGSVFAAPATVQGVGNFQKVDEHVYRGAQPTDEGFRNLSKLGIKTIIDLREFDDRSRAEQKSVTAAGMQYIGVPMKGMQRPSDASVYKVLSMLEDTSTGPVFVHCKRGADRTGNVIACYRVEHDHWTNDRALTEAKSMGMSFLERAIQHYVMAYQPRSLQDAAPKTLDASAPIPLATVAGVPAAETATALR